MLIKYLFTKFHLFNYNLQPNLSKYMYLCSCTFENLVIVLVLIIVLTSISVLVLALHYICSVLTPSLLLRACGLVFRSVIQVLKEQKKSLFSRNVVLWLGSVGER